MPNFNFTLTVYNGAGESVRVITSDSHSASNPGADFDIPQPAFAPKNGQQAAILAGGQTHYWDGSNDTGQDIMNGVYYVKLEVRDQFGHVETSTKEITLISSGDSYTVRIFNAAGEQVAQLMASSGSGSSPSHFLADKATLALGPDAGPAGTVTFDLGNGVLVAWDGTDSQGQHVASGHYTAQLLAGDGGASKAVSSAGLTVLNVGGSLMGKAVAAPNPLNLMSSAGAQPGSLPAIVVAYNPVPGMEVRARLYNSAGELVAQGTNDSTLGRLQIQFARGRISSGIFILALEARAPWGSFERQSLKFVVMQ